MEVEVKLISKDQTVIENLDESYLGQNKKCLLYFEDASFRFADVQTPTKVCIIYYKDIELEILKKHK